jgi:hypothetical protein
MDQQQPPRPMQVFEVDGEEYRLYPPMIGLPRCDYCGSVLHGDRCESCGAPR